ncbi:ferredoxin reductase [Cohnella faecalis]|uniref:Ferredoxin reductase n=2 Tax=Cohnella faecalis TaxID=2315694 RepID=A0A398CKQ4_9BACL|nr:ferredoxin reductase [Cohnella faecalis]
MVIIGAGESGARAAVELRAKGWAGSITLIGNEDQLPYERPPLSKHQLYQDEEPIPTAIVTRQQISDNRIQLISDDPAIKIDPVNHVVELKSGLSVPYERLLLAIGARSRQLNVPGAGAQEILYLRNFADALRLRGRLQPRKHIAIIGGGFIGLEVAASAIAKGCRVTLIEVAPRILMRGVPKEIADEVEQLHRHNGVEFIVGKMIDSVDKTESGYRVVLADGSDVACDVVLAGVGAIPETTLAEDCGLEIENGIKVNEYLVTSDPDIWAAGDCCSFPHPLYGGRRIRLESWRNAQNQGAHAAASMLGSLEPYASVPWFWSDQYDQTLQVAGLTDGTEQIVFRDMGDAGKLYFHLAQDGRLVSVSGIGPEGGLSKNFRFAEMLAEKQAKPDPASLADNAVSLKGLLKNS